jgi:hypothetical protein
MKFRNRFVSNSSSSSFLITNVKNGYIDLSWLAGDVLIVNDELGKTEFGWGYEELFDWGDRINFAYLQTQFKNSNPSWLPMLEKVIRAFTKVSDIQWRITTDYDTPEGYSWGCIDHQSGACDNENIEIFENEQSLKDFLFGKDSYIVLDNDNH